MACARAIPCSCHVQLTQYVSFWHLQKTPGGAAPHPPLLRSSLPLRHLRHATPDEQDAPVSEAPLPRPSLRRHHLHARAIA